MKRNILPCCFFPTTTLLIDDNISFLQTLALELSQQFLCQSFDKPAQALQFLAKEGHTDNFIMQQYVSGKIDELDITQVAVNVDIESIHSEIYHEKRFARVSVIVVDYAMPSMNGLDFCRELKNTPLQKIMLTGEADYDIGVQAFNDGIIDHFILKDSQDYTAKLVTAIKDLQQRYFAKISEIVLQSLQIDTSMPLSDSAFIELFESVCDEHDIVETYLLDHSGSFLLIDKKAKPLWLVVKTEDDMQVMYEMADGEKAPLSVLQPLRDRSKLAYLSSSQERLLAPQEWGAYLHDAQKLRGRKNYYYTLLGRDLSDQLKYQQITSYRDYVHHI